MNTIRTGREALVQGLLSHGIDTIFALPGVHNDPFYNAVYDAGDQIRAIQTRHEQGAAYMALGYALASGKTGVYVVVPGPGFLNTTAALATAYATHAPVLCLAGQIHSDQIGRGYGMLHEIPDQLTVMRSLTKWARRAESPAELPQLLATALSEMRSGRPRPVGLETPINILAAKAEMSDGPIPLTVRWPEVDTDAIEEAARLMGAARTPVIFVGGGAIDAGEEVRALAEALQPPSFQPHLRSRRTPLETGRSGHRHRHTFDQTVYPVAAPQASVSDTHRNRAAGIQLPGPCRRDCRGRQQGCPARAAASPGALQPAAPFPHRRNACSAQGDGSAL